MRHLFVLDDRVTNRNILTRLATSVAEDIEVHAFPDPISALKHARDGLPDLVITDYKMPEMDGAAFIREFRRIPGAADVPIIVITVYEDRDYCYRALEAGATDFLLSPVDHLEFRARARNLLTLRQQKLLLEQRARTLEDELADHQTRQEAMDAQWLRTLDRLPACLSVIDRDGFIKLANRAHDALFGADTVGKTLTELHGPLLGERESMLNQKVIDTGRDLAAVEQQVVDREGAQKIFLTTRSPVFDANGEVTNVVSVGVDITDIREIEESLRNQQSLDPLTGLVNRDRLMDRVQQEGVRTLRTQDISAFVLLDLDRFKGVRNVKGEAFSDALLVEVSKRLARNLREGDTLARMGGDEFGILATDLRRADDAVELVLRLRDSFATPIHIQGQEVHSSASFGIAMIPQDGRSAEQIASKAELAMYRAKAAGRDCYRFYAQEMNVSASRLLAMERDLRDALARGQFILHYQPQYELATNRVSGAEALIRWQHPEHGLILPGEFISLCEELGLIGALSNWVLSRACADLGRWQSQGSEICIAVNISPAQFRVPGLELTVERILAETQIHPSSLELELTETSIIDNSQNAIESLDRLSKLGIAITLDDFGTGYSSLSYVRRLPVRKLKIDQSFIHNMANSDSDRSIVEGIIQLCHRLNLTVTAEGVEKPAQLEMLRAMGCDSVQGQLISPPIPADEFAERFALPAPAEPEQLASTS